MAHIFLWIQVHIILFLTNLDAGCTSEQQEHKVQAATAPGDIIIGGIFPIHESVIKNTSFKPIRQPCFRIHESGLTDALAMIKAIQLMNKSPLLADANVSLGYCIIDSCSDVSAALRATKDWYRQDNNCNRSSCSICSQPVKAVVGASHSEISIAVAQQLTLQMIPQISYSSTAVILSDKKRFPAFMRTVPNDKHQTAAMVSLLSNFGWNWVGIITTDGNYGLSALENFLSQTSKQSICVAFEAVVPASLSSKHISSAMKKTAETVLAYPKVQVIVSFVQPTHMKYLYQELKSLVLTTRGSARSIRRLWLASDAWSSAASTLSSNLSMEDIGQVVGFHFKSRPLVSFNEYLNTLAAAEENIKSSNPFLWEYFAQLNNTDNRDNAKVGLQALSRSARADTIFSIDMAVSAIAQAAAKSCKSEGCKALQTMQPWKMLKTLRMQEFSFNGVRHTFDMNGEINLGYEVTMWKWDGKKFDCENIVAEYHPVFNNFTHYSAATHLQDLKHIVSKCSDTCKPGEFKKTSKGQHICCYDCINCTENYYTNLTDMDQCLSCDPYTEWSPKGSDMCYAKELLFFSWQDSFAIVLLAFSGLGILLALLVSALFLHQHNTPVVKAAGGPLSQVILLSLVCSYISSMLFVGRPNTFQCKARQVLFGISFTLCVSCILVKSLQILLAFQFDPVLQEVLRKFYKPYGIIFTCVALQAVTCICWLVLQSPFSHINRQTTTLLEYCHEGSYLAFGVMLGFIAILAFICFIFAFKGRKLPQYYNEARFITFSMLLYLISWLLFIPVYVTTSGVYLPAVEMVVILISTYGVLSCHFFPKCYIMIFKKEQNTKSAFEKQVYEYSNRTVESVFVSGQSGSLKQSRVKLESILPFSILKANSPKVSDVKACCITYLRASVKRHCLRRCKSL